MQGLETEPGFKETPVELEAEDEAVENDELLDEELEILQSLETEPGFKETPVELETEDKAVENDELLDEELEILRDLETESGFEKTPIELEAEQELDELESMGLSEDIEFEEGCSKIKEAALPDQPETMELADCIGT